MDTPCCSSARLTSSVRWQSNGSFSAHISAIRYVCAPLNTLLMPALKIEV